METVVKDIRYGIEVWQRTYPLQPSQYSPSHLVLARPLQSSALSMQCCYVPCLTPSQNDSWCRGAVGMKPNIIPLFPIRISLTGKPKQRLSNMSQLTVQWGRCCAKAHGEPELINGAIVSADLFPLLRVTPVLGRPFTRTDDQPNATPVIVIGHDLWRRRFNSDQNIVGRQIKIGSGSASVIGVLPEDLRFPSSGFADTVFTSTCGSLG